MFGQASGDRGEAGKNSREAGGHLRVEDSAHECDADRATDRANELGGGGCHAAKFPGNGVLYREDECGTGEAEAGADDEHSYHDKGKRGPCCEECDHTCANSGKSHAEY